MIKSEIKVGSTLAKTALRVAEKVEKTEAFTGTCTHINILVGKEQEAFDDMADTREVPVILIHAGTSTMRYKNFDMSKVVDNPVISNIFYQQPAKR